MPPLHTHPIDDDIDNDDYIDTNDCYGDNDDYDDKDDGVRNDDGNDDELMGVCPCLLLIRTLLMMILIMIDGNDCFYDMEDGYN